MSRAAKPRKRKTLAPVVAFPSSHRPVDAVNVITEACAMRDIRGVIVVIIDHESDMELTTCGEVPRSAIAWAAAALLRNSTCGDDG